VSKRQTGAIEQQERSMKKTLSILGLSTALALTVGTAAAETACKGLIGRDLQQASIAGVCERELNPVSAAALAETIDSDSDGGGSESDHQPERADPPANNDGAPPNPDNQL
jgi:hypothetical protein